MCGRPLLPPSGCRPDESVWPVGTSPLRGRPGYWRHASRRDRIGSCGGWTRTSDLQVMSLARFQLLHPAARGSRIALAPWRPATPAPSLVAPAPDSAGGLGLVTRRDRGPGLDG